MRSIRILGGMVGAALAMATAFSAHADDVLAKVKAAGVLSVGTETAFAPFDFIDAGEHVGLNVDMFAEIGKELGVKIEWVTLPWDGVLPGLESGKFDMVAGPATITKARLEHYRFTVPIAEATIALLARKDAHLTKPEDIAGKAVGSGKATSQLAQLQEYAKTLPTPPTVREYVSFNDAYADMAAGRIVAVGNSLPNIAYVASQRSDMFEVIKPPFGTPSYFGFIGRKDEGSTSLMDAIDAAILKMKADGRMATLQKKWFGDTFNTPDKPIVPAF